MTKYLKEPLCGNGVIILSEEFTLYQTCVFYEKKGLIVVYLDASDPPDFLLVIPYQEILNEPLLTLDDQRIAYQGKFFVHGEMSWSNDIEFFDNHVGIQIDEGIRLFDLDNIKNEIWIDLERCGFRFSVIDVIDGVMSVKYLDSSEDACQWENAIIETIQL